MNKIKILAWVLMGAMALTACDKKQHGEEPTLPDTKVHFASKINDLRVENNKWNTGDALGIYALNTGKTNLTTDIYNNYANVKYTSNTDGVFTEAGSPIIFPKDGSALDFVAYYPYQEGLANGIYKINVKDQSNPAALDLIYSNSAKSYTKANPNVNLIFNHELSFVTLKLSAMPGAVVSFEEPSASFEGLVTAADFNLSNGLLTLGETKEKMILNVQKVSDTQVMISMVLLPGTKIEEGTLSVTLGGKEYTWQSEVRTLEKGKKYGYTLAVGEEAEIKTIFGSTITDWTEENIEGGTLKPKEDQSGGSSPTDPDNGGSGNGDSGDQGGGDSGDQGGGDSTPAPTPGNAELLFAGSDFEDEEVFNASLDPKHPLKPFGKIMDGGKMGQKALQINTDKTTNNEALFTATHTDKSFEGKRRITFFMKGHSSKSFSIFLYLEGGAKYKSFNLGAISSDKELTSSGSASYAGAIDTNNQWVKVTLNIGDIATNIAKSGSFFSIRYGKEANYDVFIDHITVE
ncbi:fimbrillin family protein [Porphyromonas sp.]|uniref:fimbrillin family protein n=1 Tax=Porphyromonas sp. TaxID=1924944 RepID=UPI0026DC4A78|nr:fimbrillin family protein [Porphyromonas sp.]MDO4770830.1 fimbrillin family protein [Porphyromonas sp.]